MHRLNNEPNMTVENKCNNCSCCVTDGGRCPIVAQNKAVIASCLLLSIGIIFYVIQIYLLNKRWRIGTASWKYSVSKQSSLNTKQYPTEEGNTQSNDGKDRKLLEEENLFDKLKPSAAEQSSWNHNEAQNTAAKDYDNAMFRDGKKKSSGTVDCDFSVANPLVGKSLKSSLKIENELDKDYDYASSLMIQNQDRTSESLPEGKKKSPLPDQRGKTVRKIRARPNTYSKQEIVKPSNTRRSKFPSPPFAKRSMRQKKIKSKKVDETEYIEWSTCNTKAINCTRNLNDGFLNPSTVCNRSKCRSMSIDTACLADMRKSGDSYDDSDSDEDVKEEITPQLNWYIQKLKAKHNHLLQKSRSLQVNRKSNYTETRKAETLGSKSSQSIGVLFLLDKKKNDCTDDFKTRSSADYLTLMDMPSQIECETLLEEVVVTANDDLSRGEKVSVSHDLVRSEEIVGVVDDDESVEFPYDDHVRGKDVLRVVNDDFARSEKVVCFANDDFAKSEEMLGFAKNGHAKQEEVLSVVSDDHAKSEVLGVVDNDLAKGEEVESAANDDLAKGEEVESAANDDLAKGEEVESAANDDLAKSEKAGRVANENMAKVEQNVCVANDDHAKREEVLSVVIDDLTNSEEVGRVANDVMAKREEVVCVN